MPASLSLVAEQAEFIEAIRTQLAPGETPAVVAIDTLNRSFIGSESDDRDMTAYVRAADAIRDAFNCLVVIIHHSGLDATRPRGHTALAGAVDAQLAVRKAGEGQITCTVELMKDGAAGETVSARLEQVEVGADETGEAITSCLVHPIRSDNSPPPVKPRAPIAGQATVGLARLVRSHLERRDARASRMPSEAGNARRP